MRLSIKEELDSPEYRKEIMKTKVFPGFRYSINPKLEYRDDNLYLSFSTTDGNSAYCVGYLIRRILILSLFGMIKKPVSLFAVLGFNSLNFGIFSIKKFAIIIIYNNISEVCWVRPDFLKHSLIRSNLKKIAIGTR